MATDSSRRLLPDALQGDQDALTAIQSFKNYAPANSAFAAQALCAKLDAMKQAEVAEVNAENAAKAERDAANTAE